MGVCKKVSLFIERASWIRKMFEEGEELKRRIGEENVFDFSLGNPDIEPPDRLKEVIIQLMRSDEKGMHRYMSNAGFWETRKAVAEFLSEERSVEFSFAQVIMTVGAAGGLNVVLKSILDPGDEVIVPSPYFVEYDFYMDNHGGISKKVRTNDDFSLNIDAISSAITSNTKAIIINNPNNPTGRIYGDEEIRGLAEVLAYFSNKYGRPIYLISDEPYRRLSYGKKVPDIFEYYKESILVNSFSKDLSIPGERIGYIAIHPEMHEGDHLIKAFTFCNRTLGYVNAPAIMQRAIPYILREPAPVEIFKRRRDLLCSALNSFGYELIWPDGTFYVFPRSPIKDDRKFVSLLREENILVVPGSGFGGDGYFRISYCMPEERIEKALNGFKKALLKARS